MSAAPFPPGAQVRLSDSRRGTVVGSGDVNGTEVRIVKVDDRAPTIVVGLDGLTEFVPQGIEGRYTPFLTLRVLDGEVVGANIDWSDCQSDEAYDYDLGSDVEYPEGHDAVTDAFLGFLPAGTTRPARTAIDDAAALRRIADLIERGDDA